MSENIGPCSMELPHLTMEMAGAMVSLDLTKPIDVSQMQIDFLEEMPCEENCTRTIYFERKTVLKAFVFNDGEREELEITFKLKSKRMPKIPEQK